MLTTGIDVEARPPGKKVKRLSLLSGGERSLVAVAFLVALFKARPSPFYILDEVEAALDDTNLGRLLEIYEELRDNSQLIVITHQKRTMEVADALYGVSMRGDGVSAVISQRLREEEIGVSELRTDYPAIRTITTRWEDEDVYGHVNNVVYYSFFDTAVNGYLIDDHGRRHPPARRLRHRRRDAAASSCASCDFPATSTPASRSPSSARRASSTRSACSRATTTSRPPIGRFVHVYVSGDDRAVTPIPDVIRTVLEPLA